jgi:hypothetical protein
MSESNTPSPLPHESERDRGPRYEAAERLRTAANDLLTISGEHLIPYVAGSFVTYQSLFNLVLAEDAIKKAGPIDHASAEKTADIMAALPVSAGERAALAVNMRVRLQAPDFYDGQAWYDDAPPHDLVMLRKWGRWLGELFPDSESYEENPAGPEFIHSLGDLADALIDGPERMPS